MVKFNKNEFKWFLILIAFTYYIYTLLNSGKIYYFIHPRMIKYVRLSFFFLIILIIIQIRRIFTIAQKRSITAIAFLLPVILGFLINPQGMSVETAANKGVASGKTSISVKDTTVINTNVKNDMIVIDDSNYTETVDDIIYNDPGKYKGKRITITGLVYRDPLTMKNEFEIVRLMIICCAADAEATGLLCNWSNADSLKNDQWVTVTGVLDVGTQKDYEGGNQTVPIIRVENSKPAKKPKNTYIYPEQLSQ